MLDHFRQAVEDALSLHGESALLRGTEPCQVAVERGVQLSGLDTEYETARDTRNAIYTRDIATIDSLMNPKAGDSLTIGAEDYLLDAKVDDSGAYARFIIVKV
jgi:hypothetical protein